MPNDLSPWTSALLYQTDCVARDRLETPPVGERVEQLLQRLLSTTSRCLPTHGGEVLTILPSSAPLARHAACHGKGCTADGCQGSGWIRTHITKEISHD